MNSTHRLWKQVHGRTRGKHGLPDVSTPWSSRTDIKMAGVPGTDRALDVVNIGYSVLRDSFPNTTPRRDIIAGAWVNTNENPSRSPWSVGYCPAPSRHCLLYSLQYDTALSGPALIRAHGFPRDPYFEQLSNSQCMDLAGEQFSVPVYAACFMGLFSWPDAAWWWSSGSAIRPM